MLTRYLSNQSDTDQIIPLIREIAADDRRIDSPIHNFYKYPACFPPNLVRFLIANFSSIGDTVLDPFMGGGTSAIESITQARNIIGVDINDLSIFSTKLKTLSLKSTDIRELDSWASRISLIDYDRELRLTKDEQKIFKDIPRRISNILAQSKSLTNRLSPNAKTFASGVLLNSARMMLDNRERIPEPTRVMERLQLDYEQMLAACLQFTQAYPPAKRGRIHLVQGDSSLESTYKKVSRLNKKISLVVTSPPYPGISILYNRWQINGRRETTLPYWIIRSDQDQPSSFYTMGHPKTATGQEQYFRTIKSSFSNIRSVLERNTLLIQVVAFSDRKGQLYPYLDAMDESGFEEIRNLTRTSYDGRLWRPVSNRKWYNHIAVKKAERKEVIFFYRAK